MILLIFLIFDNSFDRKIRDIFQRNRTPFLDKTFLVITESADKDFFLLSEVLLSTFFSEHERDDAKLTFLGVSSVSFLTLIIKYITRRERPSGENKNPFNSSFPSGHASGSFTFAYILSKRHKNLTIPLFLWSSLVGVSRIYLDRHWTTDVLAGSILGLSYGIIFMKYEKILLKFKIK